MALWADYGVSKITYIGNQVSSAYVYRDKGDRLTDGQSVSSDWINNRLRLGYSFCAITRNSDGNWVQGEMICQAFGPFKRITNMPLNLTRRKVFVSYYHKDDQYYKNAFHSNFNDLFIDKSVGDGDIDSNNGPDYVSRLINQGYMNDTTVLVVLVGPKTRCRKHVDWEISGALDYRVGDCHSGLVGLLLPNHPDYGTRQWKKDNLPARLAANAETGYAPIYDWTTNRATMQSMIEEANRRRKPMEDKIVNRYLLQMSRNLCD